MVRSFAALSKTLETSLRLFHIRDNRCIIGYVNLEQLHFGVSRRGAKDVLDCCFTFFTVAGTEVNEEKVQHVRRITRNQLVLVRLSVDAELNLLN